MSLSATIWARMDADGALLSLSATIWARMDADGALLSLSAPIWARMDAAGVLLSLSATIASQLTRNHSHSDSFFLPRRTNDFTVFSEQRSVRAISP